MAYIGVKCTGADVPVYVAKTRLDIRLSDCDGRRHFAFCLFLRGKLHFQPTFAHAPVNVQVHRATE